MGQLNIEAPTTESEPPVERITLTSVGPTSFSALFEAGERLLASLAAEERRCRVYPKDIAEAVGYLEETAALRQLVDECAKEYCRVLSNVGVCDLPSQDGSGSSEIACRSHFARLSTSGSV